MIFANRFLKPRWIAWFNESVIDFFLCSINSFTSQVLAMLKYWACYFRFLPSHLFILAGFNELCCGFVEMAQITWVDDSEINGIFKTCLILIKQKKKTLYVYDFLVIRPKGRCLNLDFMVGDFIYDTQPISGSEYYFVWTGSDSVKWNPLIQDNMLQSCFVNGTLKMNAS